MLIGLPSGTALADWLHSAAYADVMTRVAVTDDPDLARANQSLCNVIHIWPGLEPYKYDSDVNWEVEGKSNTWYLYFQSLRVVGYLANAAERTGESRYVEKAVQIIESWCDFHLENQRPPRYAWYDHSVANRTRNIMHFLRACSVLTDVRLTDSFIEKVAMMLCLHGDWLLDRGNYHPNNHGLMASMALTQIALTFPELDRDGLWKEAGISRIRERIEADLSAENVHLEHSAFYHVFFLDLVLQISRYLQTRGVGLFEPDDNTVAEMKQCIAYLVKPNGRLPMMGDTNDSRVWRHYDHPWIVYALSNGRQGERPPSNSMVYPCAGVAILRDEWREGREFAWITYLMFQSKFTTRGHKHADDLGFVLYSHGEDILVGPGVYAFDDSKYRQYVRSAQAHNTLTVDSKSYSIAAANVGKARISAYRLDEAFDFVQGSHTMYDGVTLRRGIVFIRPSTILVIDEAISENEHSIQQIWNLAPAAHGLEFDRDGASFLVGERGVAVQMRQLGSAEAVTHYYGQDEPVRGFISPRQRELVPIHQLEFENHGRGVVFVTQISVTGPGEEAPTIDIDLDDPYRSIVVLHDDGTTLTIELDGAAVNSEW